MDFTLANGRQQEYYRTLCKKGIPGLIQFEFPVTAHPSVDFLVALYALWVHNPSHRPWIATHVAPLIQQKIRTITKGQQKALNTAIDQVIKNDFLRGQCQVSAFTTAENDSVAAIRIVSNLAETLLEGNFISDAHLPTLGCLLTLVVTQKVTRTWNSFIKALHDGNEHAAKTLENLFEFWNVNGEIPFFVGSSELPNGIRKVKSVESELILAVPDEYVNYTNTHLELLRQKYNPSTAPIAEMLKLFWSSRDSFQNRAERMWQETVNDASCDIQPDGSDSVEISISALREHGIRRIQMIPKTIRPDTTAVIWYQSPVSGRPFWCTYDLKSADLQFPVIDSVDGNLNRVVQSLYRYLAITGLWAICTGKHEKGAGDRLVAGSCKPNGESHRLPRAHFRRIEHLGYHASPAALARLASHWPGRLPPPGKTFVKPEKVVQRSAPNSMVASLADLSIICRLNERYLHP